MPKLLTEKSGVLQYIKEEASPNKHYLGKLAGIGGEWTRPTRNGRRYPLKLWENIENSEDFKEGMETHTIFGETDHPETRVETSIKEIAIVLTKYEIRRNEGHVYTEFHILDTPNGRILKELLDYGSQIGVSTRGLGDEIVEDGETIIDPDTYLFYGWDAVVMPAVKAARPAVVESNKRSLIESFSREIESASSVAELESIKRIANKVSLPELDSVMESIDIKLNTISDGDDISSKLEEDLGRISEENIALQEANDRLKAEVSASNTRIKELMKIIEGYRTASKSLSENLRTHMVSEARMQDELYESAREAEHSAECVRQNEALLSKSRKTVRSLRTQIEQLTTDNESKSMIIESKDRKIKKIEDQIATLDRDKKKLESVNRTLRANAQKLTEQVNKMTSQQTLLEQRSSNNEGKLRKALAESKASVSKVTSMYLKSKCAESGIGIDTATGLLPKNYTTEDVDRVIAELADRKLRYSKLSFDTSMGTPTRVVESSVNSLSEEDAQTLRFLQESAPANNHK